MALCILACAQGEGVHAGDGVTVTVQNPKPVSATDELTVREVAVGMLGSQPLVTLTAPGDGAVLRRGSILPLAGEASGTAAAVVRAEFLIDGVAVGSQTIHATEPTTLSRFNYQWQATPGTHTVAARAVDADGRVGTSKSATITVK